MDFIKEVIEGEEFIFDYRRVIYWPRNKILIATDLHWGKTTFLQMHGIPVSDKILDEDLKRLSEVISQYNPQTFIVLGDLIHHEKSLSRNLVEKIIRFREVHPCELILIKGNHDLYTVFPESWGIVEESEFMIDNFYFVHEYKKNLKRYQFSGHLHPRISLSFGNDHLKLPAFILTKDQCLLPAFSHFTSGLDIRPSGKERVIAVLPSGLELIRYEKNREQE